MSTNQSQSSPEEARTLASPVLAGYKRSARVRTPAQRDPAFLHWKDVHLPPLEVRVKRPANNVAGKPPRVVQQKQRTPAEPSKSTQSNVPASPKAPELEHATDIHLDNLQSTSRIRAPAPRAPGFLSWREILDAKKRKQDFGIGAPSAKKRKVSPTIHKASDEDTGTTPSLIVRLKLPRPTPSLIVRLKLPRPTPSLIVRLKLPRPNTKPINLSGYPLKAGAQGNYINVGPKVPSSTSSALSSPSSSLSPPSPPKKRTPLPTYEEFKLAQSLTRRERPSPPKGRTPLPTYEEFKRSQSLTKRGRPLGSTNKKPAPVGRPRGPKFEAGHERRRLLEEGKANGERELQCTYIKSDGRQCRNWVVFDGTYAPHTLCMIHDHDLVGIPRRAGERKAEQS